jgi:hypothetical protein
MGRLFLNAQQGFGGAARTMCNHTLLRFPLRIQVRIPNLLASLGHTVSRLTVILTDIRSILVRIVGTKFAH